MTDAAATYAEFHRRSLEDRDAFWREQAKLIDWKAPFTTVCCDVRATSATPERLGANPIMM